MKRLLLLLLVAAACTPYALSQSGRKIANRTTPAPPVQPALNSEPELPKPKPAPGVLRFLPERVWDRRIRTLDNNHFRLADFQGKVLVINLWASWCGPCRREVPEYETIRSDYLGREVEFIGLTVNDSAAAQQVNRFVRQTNFGFLLGWADEELARTLMNGKGAIPQTLVIDTQGNVVNHWTGYDPRRSGVRLREAIENALK
jgi:thiol-disulfide isomerase/thioredoxin